MQWSTFCPVSGHAGYRCTIGRLPFLRASGVLLLSAIDVHLYQHRPFGRESCLQRSIELCDADYTGCWHSLRLGKRAKIELWQAATHALRQSEMAGEIVKGFVGAVLDDNERYG